MNLRNLALLGLLITLAGCTVTKVPVATGGSRADGIVEMSYECPGIQTCNVDWNKSSAEAARRCSVWGYSNAEPFGGAKTVCTQPGGFGCNLQLITMQYQCLE